MSGAGLAAAIAAAKKMDVQKADEDANSMDGVEAAASDLLAAIDKKDAAGVADALRSAVQICMNQYEQEEPPTEA